MFVYVEERDLPIPRNEKLIAAREARGWSQTKAAEKIGMSRGHYARLEVGTVVPHGSTIGLLCQAFHMSSVALGYPQVHLSGDLSLLVSEEQITTPTLPKPIAALYNSSESNMLVASSQRVDNVFLIEVNTRDCAMWFSEQLAQIIAFVQQYQGHTPALELQKMLDRELHMFDVVKTMFDADTYFLSRRSTLLVIAALPKGLLSLVQQQKVAFIEETVLPSCAASITACWHLLSGREFASVEQSLSRYMPFLITWAQQSSSSSSQKTSAYLAAQCYMLLGLIALHRLHFQQRIIYCKEAVKYAKESENNTLLVKALTQLGNAYYHGNHYPKMLQTCQQAQHILNETKEPIPYILQSKVFTGLAHAYAQHGQEVEALNAMSKARAVYPGTPEEVPVFLSADEGLFSLILFDGLVHLDLGKHLFKQGHYVCAAKALSRIEEFSPTLFIPERIRVEITNERAQAAIALNDLDAFQEYTLQSVESLKVMQSEKRRQELLANYKAARIKWPHEPHVLELADLLLGYAR